MLETAIVIFREGLEAFLIIAIMLAYITKTRRFNLIKPVYAGVFTALAISATTGYHVAELAQDPVWEGALAMIAGALVASFTIHIMRTAKTIRQDINNKIEENAQKVGVAAEIGVFAFTILMIAREGMETALMLGALNNQMDPSAMWAGALIGGGMVALIAYLWSSQSTKINIKLFLQVTGIFLVLFSLELFVYGLHELSEMYAIPLVGQDVNLWFHHTTEPLESEFVSNFITLGLLGIPTFWLLGSYVRDKFLSSPAPVAAE